MEHAIKITKLTKQYTKEARALSELTLNLEKGKVYAFLGPNGAGKTTTIKILTGLLRPTEGTVSVLGEDPWNNHALMSRIGYVQEDQAFYDWMTVKQVLDFAARAHPFWKQEAVEKYIKTFSLPPEQKVKKLSKGMRGKLALLLALGHDPELLILDEPTSGLDPISRKEFLSIVLTEFHGKTIFFSSHQISEVERIADVVCIINKGSLVLQEELDFLKENYRLYVIQEEAFSKIPDDESFIKVGADNGNLLLYSKTPEMTSALLSRSGVPFDEKRLSLEDVFFEAVNELRIGSERG